MIDKYLYQRKYVKHKGEGIMKFGILLLLSLLVIPLAQCEIESLGTFKIRECISLSQVCANCSYVNISSVTDPNSNQVLGQVKMTKTGTKYNYTSCAVSATTGKYIVNGFGDVDGVVTVFAYDYTVTPSGTDDTKSYNFYIIILVISGVVIAAGFLLKDAPITILGTFGLYFVGLYILFNGIAGIKDLITTWAIGIILLGIAMYISIRSAYELIEEAE